MRILIVVAAMAGCSASDDRVAIPDAAIAAVTCGPAPLRPEIPLIVSSVDENGTKLVTVDRAHWDRLLDYGSAVRAWSLCMTGH